MPLGNSKTVTQLGSIGSAVLAADDLFTFVDISDTTFASTGTNKKITSTKLASELITLADNLNLITGPKGDTGNTGPQGLQGLQGLQGAKGDTGASGASNVDTTTILNTGGILSVGVIAEANIGANAVITTKILDSNITTAKILDSNITTAKIANLNVTTEKIANLNVTTAKIADANITAPKLNGAQTGNAPIFGVRAWCDFDATKNAAGVTNGDHTARFLTSGANTNIASVTKTATGKYTVLFSVAMPNATYAVIPAMNLADNNTDDYQRVPKIFSKTTSGFGIAFYVGGLASAAANPVSGSFCVLA